MKILIIMKIIITIHQINKYKNNVNLKNSIMNKKYDAINIMNKLIVNNSNFLN